jgi:hypothetical protein
MWTWLDIVGSVEVPTGEVVLQVKACLFSWWMSVKAWPTNIQIDSKVLRPALGHMNAKVDGFVNFTSAYDM